MPPLNFQKLVCVPVLTPPVSVTWLGSLSFPQSCGATRELFSKPRLQLALNLSAPLTLLGALAPDLDRCLKSSYVNKSLIVCIARPDILPISNEEDEQLNNFAPYFLCSAVLSLSYLPAKSTFQCWFWTTPWGTVICVNYISCTWVVTTTGLRWSYWILLPMVLMCLFTVKRVSIACCSV